MTDIVFALRFDALQKPGGDSTKVNHYRDGLESRGWTTATVTDPRDIQAHNPKIIHLMNLDLPRENLSYVDTARRLNSKVVISTIRHPFEGVSAMYRYGADTLYEKTRRLRMSPERAVGLREQIRLAKNKRARSASRIGQYLDLQRKLINSVDHYFPMAQGEATAIQRDFRTDTPWTLVRNGVSFDVAQSNERSGARYEVISVGRIEPRKNSLALAEAAHELRCPTLFVGAVNSRHSTYAARFTNLTKISPYITYGGKVPHADLPEYIKTAKTYINPAWFEVVSQADIESAALGLNIVTTRHSYVEDELGHDTTRLDPIKLVHSPAESLEWMIQNARPAKPPKPRPWSECGGHLDEAYQSVLS